MAKAVRFASYVDLGQFTFSGDAGGTWIDLMKVGNYQHPLYGKINFDPTRLQQFADNVNNNVRGIPLSIDYDHNSSNTSTEAAGWIRQARVMGDTLQGLVDWTKTAQEKIKERAYRFFSPEYRDEWTDNSGKTWRNVLFGGGITNRPFLKDLLPLNLSELTFGEPPKKEEEVDPKKLREQLGLPETATDAEVDAKIAEMRVLSEAARLLGTPAVPPTPAPTPAPAPAPTPAPTVVPTMPPSLVLLAEQNPAVKALMDHLNAQAKQLAEQTQSLREGTVTSKLAEFNALGDSGKLVMTPAAQELVREMLLHEAWPTALTEKFWELMSMVKTSASFVVELGERAAGARGYSPQPVQDRVTREIEQLMKTDKNLDYATAATRVLSDPKVWDAYREASTSFVE